MQTWEAKGKKQLDALQMVLNSWRHCIAKDAHKYVEYMLMAHTIHVKFKKKQTI